MRLFKFAPLLLVAQAYGQTISNSNFHGWYTYSGDHSFGKSKWGINTDLQWRRHDVIRKWQQLFLRSGVTYRLNSLVTLQAGHVNLRSYPYSEYPAPRHSNEHRLWYGPSFRYGSKKLGWSSRVLFENRYIDSRDRLGYVLNNRVRAQQSVRIPLRGPYYFTASDEFIMHVKPNQFPKAYNQNRAYVAIGKSVHKYLRFEAGYMNQHVVQRNGRIYEWNHTLRIGLVGNAPIGW